MAQRLVDGDIDGLSSADQALCRYAIALTRTPDAMEASDVAALREAGFSDDEVTIATQVIGYFNYINRMAEGLGVEPEAWMQPDRATWLARRAARASAGEGGE